MKKKVILYIIILLICICMIIISRNTIFKLYKKIIQSEDIKKQITYEIYECKDGKISMLITIEDTENGLSQLIYPNDENILQLNGENKFAIDYNIISNGVYTFKAINTLGEEITNTIVVDDNFRKNIIPIEVTKESNSQVALNIDYKDETDKYYKIGKASTEWTNYPGTLRIDAYQLKDAINEDGTISLSIKQVNDIGKEIIIENKDISVPDVSTYREEDITISGESIIKCVEDNTLENGNYIFEVNGETYPVELYNFNEDVVYKAQNNINIDGVNQYGIGNTTSDERMLVLKFNRNLEIEEGAIITPNTRKKGMFIYTANKINNKGTISMTARGAKAQGQNVYLWKDSENQYEYVPAYGASGGSGVQAPSNNNKPYTSRKNGNQGINGTTRETGGGRFRMFIFISIWITLWYIRYIIRRWGKWNILFRGNRRKWNMVKSISTFTSWKRWRRKWRRRR